MQTKTPSGSAIPPQMTISAILDDGSLVPLTQSGASPMNVYGPGDRMTLEFAVGPTGIVAMNDTTLWLGLPS